MTTSFSTNDMLKAFITHFVSTQSAAQTNSNPLYSATSAQILADAENMGNAQKDETTQALRQSQAKQQAEIEAQQLEAETQQDSLKEVLSALAKQRASVQSSTEQNDLDAQMSAAQTQMMLLDLSTPSPIPGGLNLTA